MNPYASGKQINWDPITEHDQRYFKMQAVNTRGIGRKKIMKDLDNHADESETLSDARYSVGNERQEINKFNSYLKSNAD